MLVLKQKYPTPNLYKTHFNTWQWNHKPPHITPQKQTGNLVIRSTHGWKMFQNRVFNDIHIYERNIDESLVCERNKLFVFKIIHNVQKSISEFQWLKIKKHNVRGWVLLLQNFYDKLWVEIIRNRVTVEVLKRVTPDFRWK